MAVNRTKGRKKHRVLRIICFMLGFFIMSIVIASVGLLAPYAATEMDMTLMDISSVCEPSKLYAYDAKNRAARTGELHLADHCTLTEARPRIFVSYDELPADLIHAFIAIEDKRFFDHKGVDWYRTAHAGMVYVIGKGSFGASTITQQLIKNLTGDDEYSLSRKCTEIFRALDLERKADKSEILEAYLNIINLAEGCHGVGAAAMLYYSKPASMLTLSECATIAAITNNPARYNPLTHPDDNRQRRDLILREMQLQGYITEEACSAAITADLDLQPSVTSEAERNGSSVTSWYADMVAVDVIRDLEERLGYTHQQASMLLYSGGLTIETVMDEEMQAIVEAYYADSSHFPVGDAGSPQSALILIDPSTGDILAVAGAIGEKSGNRLQNYATDTKRPAGSCIKPLSIYAPALENGSITWADVCEDEPLYERNGLPWPANADGLYRGRVTIGEAVAQSINTVAVRLLNTVGLAESFAFLHDKLGMESLISPDENTTVHDQTVSSLALGQQSYGVTVRELTAGYTIFSDGIYRRPISYCRVFDHDGHLLLENQPVNEEELRVLSQDNAAVMTRLLQTVTEHGTAARYITISEALGIEAAGKTGTTQNNCDRWYIGYTPQLLAGVWMGYDYPTELRGISGNPCVAIWDTILSACEESYQGSANHKTAFPMTPNVIETDFCPLSGSLPNPYCTDSLYGQKIEHGWFVRGTEPDIVCTQHEEPPITLVPDDPDDPNRIPLLPNDVVTDEIPTSPSPPWYSQWFSRFSRKRNS